MRAHGVLLALLAGLCTGAPAGAADEAAPAPPKIYKWVDENGIAHYTTDPGRLPDGVQRRSEALGSDAALAREPVEARAPGGLSESWATRDRSAAPAEGDVWATGAGGASDASDDFVEGPVTAAAPPTSEDLAVRAAERDELDSRIAELEAAVAADEDVLKGMISDPTVAPLERGDDPEFRSVALRLPERLAELRALRDRREQLEK
jgi:hypothetical protein